MKQFPIAGDGTNGRAERSSEKGDMFDHGLKLDGRQLLGYILLNYG